jgi:shikimate dehydrogenase
MTSQVAVFGHPIAHSLSPRIHAAFARANAIDLEYRAIDAAPEHFRDQLASFHRDGGAGANITLPLKVQAYGYCGELSAAARRAGTVNTLRRNADGWSGHNTDGAGLIRDLTERYSLDLRDRRTLLLGAGGAARGVLWPLLDAGVAELMICNRTADTADKLADSVGDPARVHTRYWDDLAQQGSFDLIINATSAGHGDGGFSLPFSLIGARATCYDLSYGNVARSFIAWARAASAAQALDGLGMLVEQAAQSFEFWHGVYPETETVHAELRASFLSDAAD